MEKFGLIEDQCKLFLALRPLVEGYSIDTDPELTPGVVIFYYTPQIERNLGSPLVPSTPG